MTGAKSRRTTREGEGGGLCCPFLKIKKKCPDFAQEGPDCVHPQVKFTIQNVVLRVSRRKNSEIFPAGSFFLEFLAERLWKCRNSRNLSCPEKFLVARLNRYMKIMSSQWFFPKNPFSGQMHHFGPKSDAQSKLLIRCKDFFLQIFHNERGQEEHQKQNNGFSEKILPEACGSFLDSKLHVQNYNSGSTLISFLNFAQ